MRMFLSRLTFCEAFLVQGVIGFPVRETSLMPKYRNNKYAEGRREKERMAKDWDEKWESLNIHTMLYTLLLSICINETKDVHV